MAQLQSKPDPETAPTIEILLFHLSEEIKAAQALLDRVIEIDKELLKCKSV